MATTTLGTTTVTTDEVLTIALAGEAIKLTGEEAAYLIDLAAGVEDVTADEVVSQTTTVILPDDLVVTVEGITLEQDDIAERVTVGFGRVLVDLAARK